MELLSDPNMWASLFTLTVLEIVLGIDNIIFISIAASHLPQSQQAKARSIGLGLALIMRVILLSMIAWIARLTDPIFTVLAQDVSWRDLILIGGGLFLLVKGTMEIHHTVEGAGEESVSRKKATFQGVLTQIVLLDIVFSLDSVITAIGMANDLEVMIAAVVIAMAIMLFAAKPVSDFVTAHPTLKMLALSFLLLVGTALVADGLHYHIPRGYLYFAVAFSLGVESLNIWMHKKKKGK